MIVIINPRGVSSSAWGMFFFRIGHASRFKWRIFFCVDFLSEKITFRIWKQEFFVKIHQMLVKKVRTEKKQALPFLSYPGLLLKEDSLAYSIVTGFWFDTFVFSCFIGVDADYTKIFLFCGKPPILHFFYGKMVKKVQVFFRKSARFVTPQNGLNFLVNEGGWFSVWW